MTNIPIRSSGSLNSGNILSINQPRVQGALNRQNISSINYTGTRRIPDSYRPARTHASEGSYAPVHTQSPREALPARDTHPIPPLCNLIQKGQKMNIGTAGQLQRVRIAMGWNVLNPQCDIDLSAYLLNNSGKVPADDWFVFYGQTRSPDESVILNTGGSPQDREIADIDFTKLHASIRKIVFVLTINEAFARRLNFSMVKDAYIRLLNPADHREILSFMLTDYYENVTSMMLGEIYLYNDTWKFNAIGNGVARDLAGLCELYGVQTN